MKRLWVLLLVFLLLLTGCGVMDFGDATPHLDEKPSLGKEDSSTVDTQKTEKPADDPLLNTEPEKIEKDKNITYAQKAEFFDLAQKYRFDHVPALYEGETLYQSYLANYVGFIIDRGELQKTENGGYLIPGEKTAQIASELFGLDGSLYNKDYEWRTPKDLHLMAELISYQEEQVDGKTVVTAKFYKHYFSELNYIEDPLNQGFSYFPGLKEYDENSIKAYELAKKEGSDFYSAAKKLVLNGVLNDSGNGYLCEVTYETVDGKTPSRIYIRENTAYTN